MCQQQDYNIKPVRASSILTSSYVAGTVIDQCGLKNQIVLLVSATFDAGQTSAKVIVEFSDDGYTFYEESYENLGTISGAQAPFNIYQIEHTLLTARNIAIPITSKYNFIRVSAKGVGTLTNSLLKIDAIIGVS